MKITLSKGKSLHGYFREEQAKHGNLGCHCVTCIRDMERAYRKFKEGLK